MFRLVELEDGTFLLEVCIDDGEVKYHEVMHFKKVEPCNLPEKDGGYCIHFRIVI